MLGLLLEAIGQIVVDIFIGSIYNSARYLWCLVRGRRATHSENALTHT